MMATAQQTCASVAAYLRSHPDVNATPRLARLLENLAAFPEDSRVTWVLAMFRERTYDATTPQAD